MNKIFYSILFLVVACSVYAQQQEIDSLRQVLAQTTDPEEKLEILLDIGQEYVYDQPDSSIAIGIQILAASEKMGFLRGKAFAYELLGRGYDGEGDYAKSLDAHLKHLEVRIERKDSAQIVAMHVMLGNTYRKMDQPDKAMEYFVEAIELMKAVKKMNRAGLVYNSMGQVMKDQKRFDEALGYYRKGLDIKKKYEPEESLYYSYANFGEVFQNLEQYDSAIYYYKKSIEVAEKYNRFTNASVQQHNLGTLYLEQNKFELAESQFLKALPILMESGNKYYIGETYRSLARAANAQKEYAKAIKYVNMAMSYIDSTEMLVTKKAAHENLTEAYVGLGDYKNAFYHQKQANVIRDSMERLADEEKLAEIDAKFQASEKEAQIAQQLLEIERQASQKKTIVITAIAAVLALIGLFQYFRNKQKIRQKEAELTMQLQQTEAESLREVNAMKSTFFANVSHEFRTPLTLIISPLRQLLDGPSARPNPSLFRTMLLNGERLLELVNQLLDLSKAEAGQLELNLVETDVLPVLKGIAGSFTSLADVRQVRFEMVTPSGKIMARFDKDKLSKIVANLLSNAFKFTPEEGQVKLEVGTFANGAPHNGQAANNGLIFTVSDNGIGIEENELPHLFERFYQTKESRRTGLTGSGIGLALTKELVELHGGSIQVESKINEGSTFTVHLPIVTSAVDALSNDLLVEVLSGSGKITNIEFPATEEKIDHKPNQAEVLVVEDNPDVRLFIKDCLEKDYNILLAHDGKRGLEVAQSSIPDLIISDVMMPQMDGYELCQTLKTDARTSHIPVVLLTARAEQADKLEGLETGADDYLVKPFDARELRIRVANLISQRQKLQAHYRQSLTAAFIPAEMAVESMDAIFMKEVKEAVETNMEDESFSVVELASLANMSRSQLHRKLKALTNISPNQIIRDMRLERGKQLLQKKAGNVSEVAYMCGFSSTAYFSKCFKDHFGVSPGEV